MPEPETLETIAAKIDARFRTIDQQFAKIDQHFVKIDHQFAKVDQQFVETRAQLGVKIEAVDDKVNKVYDVVIAMRADAAGNADEHKTFTARLDGHDIRILALEKPGIPKP